MTKYTIIQVKSECACSKCALERLQNYVGWSKEKKEKLKLEYEISNQHTKCTK